MMIVTVKNFEGFTTEKLNDENGSFAHIFAIGLLCIAAFPNKSRARMHTC